MLFLNVGPFNPKHETASLPAREGKTHNEVYWALLVVYKVGLALLMDRIYGSGPQL